jgi:hypothetical protein
MRRAARSCARWLAVWASTIARRAAGSLAIPEEAADDLEGLAFGPDGLL